MHSKGFYSFYVLVLLLFLVLGIESYFSLRGRDEDLVSREHLLLQAKIYASNLASLGKACLKQYSFKDCRRLEFNFQGYEAHFKMTSCMQEICVIDISIQTLSPLDSLPIRYTHRAVWDLRNLQKSKNFSSQALLRL